MKKLYYFAGRLMAGVICSLLVAGAGYAKENVHTMQETVVTAQKVEENVQEIPISISLLDAYAVEDNNIRTMSDIALYIPNLQQFSVGGAGMYTPGVRGLSADVHTLHSTVATYVDGIPYISSMGNNLILEDIERVEVLRGPQGTLYGKNAYSGVINIISRAPGNELRGKVKVELGEDNKREYAAIVSGPIVKDKFYAGLSAKHYEKEGFIQNVYLNKKDDDRKDDALKLHLRAEPDSNLSLSLVSNYVEKDDDALTGASIMAPDPRITSANFEGYTRSKSLSNAFKAEYQWDKLTFSSVSTHKQYDDIRGVDYDYSPMDNMHVTVDSEYVDYSQEFRLHGRSGRFKWLGGLHFDWSDEDPYHTMSGMTTTHNTTESSGIGIFANLDYDLTDKFILVGGLRYDRDEIETEDYLQAFKHDKSYSELSPKIGLKYLHSDDLFYYATVSRGYKRGGYYFLAPADKKSYDRETLWNYEVGLKSNVFDNRLFFNLSLFYMDISDMQVTTNLDPMTAYISNAAEATSKGFELEASYRVLDHLVLFANIGYAQTEFDDFRDNLGDYSGNDNPFAPRYNYTVGAKYRDDRGIFAQLDVNGRDSFFADKANVHESDGSTILNAKIGYEAERFEIYLYGKNITDETYDIEGYFNYYTMLSPPRETGIQFAYRF